MSLLAELKRRNVFRVAILYAISTWLILQIGDVLFGVMGLPDWSLRIVLAIAILGFPPALVFAWAFELTSEGLKREKDVDRSQSISHHTARKLDVAVIVLLVATLAVFAVDRFMDRGEETTVRTESPAPTSAKADAGAGPTDATATEGPVAAAVSAPTTGKSTPSVAVLPFTNMSPDPDQEFFSDGLSDTLIHVLAQIQDLKVAARTSSFAFKGKQVDIREIAAKLGVATVLEGSVQKAGNRMRIIAQLIDASDGTHLWSATFDRSTDDIFAIQDEIATEVVKALKGTLLEEESERIAERYEPSFEAYQAFLRGRQEMARRTSEGLEAAKGHFQRALALDPDYPLAMVNLGDTYNLLSEYSDLSQPKANELSEPLYRRAVQLAPTLGEAYTSLGLLHDQKGEPEKAFEYFEKGIALNPGYSTAYHWYALRLGGIGRVEEALEMFFKAAELDPLSDVIRVNLIGFLSANNRDEEALELAHEAIRENPDFPSYYPSRGFLDLKRGDLGRFIYWLSENARRDPGSVQRSVLICWSQLNLPDTRPAKECVERVTRLSPSSDVVVSLRMAAAIILDQQPERAIEIGRSYGEITDLTQTRGVNNMLSDAYMIEGQYQRAMDLILDSSPNLHPDNNGGEVTHHNWGDAIGLAFIWRRLDQPDRSDYLIAQVWPFLDERPRSGRGGVGIADVHAYAISGRYDEAVATLAEAIKEGWVFGWRWELLHNPILEPLRQREDFRQLAEELQQRLAEQQAWLEAQPPLHEVIEAGKLDSI